MTSVGYIFKPSALKAGFSKNSWKWHGNFSVCDNNNKSNTIGWKQYGSIIYHVKLKLKKGNENSAFFSICKGI